MNKLDYLCSDITYYIFSFLNVTDLATLQCSSKNLKGKVSDYVKSILPIEHLIAQKGLDFTLNKTSCSPLLFAILNRCLSQTKLKNPTCEDLMKKTIRENDPLMLRGLLYEHGLPSLDTIELAFKANQIQCIEEFKKAYKKYKTCITPFSRIPFYTLYLSPKEALSMIEKYRKAANYLRQRMLKTNAFPKTETNKEMMKVAIRILKEIGTLEASIESILPEWKFLADEAITPNGEITDSFEDVTSFTEDTVRKSF